MKFLLLAALGAMFAQAQLTTVVGTLYLPDGTLYSGQISCTWPAPFVGGDGRIMPAGPQISTSVKNGALSINLEANSTATPTGTYYTCVYRPTGYASIAETWSVAYSATPISLTSVRLPGTPTSPTFAGIVSLNGLTPATQLFAKVNDSNVTLTINSSVSTHTFTLGWTGVLPSTRGGLNINASAFTGLLKMTSGIAGVATAGTDYVTPAGLTSALANYLPLTGGSLQSSTSTTLRIIPGASQGPNAQLIVFNSFGQIGTQFDADGVLNTFDIAGTVKKASFYGGQHLQASDVGIFWKNQTSIDTAGAFDVGLVRAAAGVLQISDGIGGIATSLAKFNIFTATTASDSLLANSQCAWLLTSNTNAQIRCRGSDATVRHADLTLVP